MCFGKSIHKTNQIFNVVNGFAIRGSLGELFIFLPMNNHEKIDLFCASGFCRADFSPGPDSPAFPDIHRHSTEADAFRHDSHFRLFRTSSISSSGVPEPKE